MHRFTDDGFDSDASDTIAREALQPVADITEPIFSVRMYQPPLDPIRILLMDGVTAWVAITEGRSPAPCAGRSTCEALRIGPEPLFDGTGNVGTSVELGGVRLDIVGVATPSSDLPLATIQPDGPLLLLVEGLSGIDESAGLLAVPRTVFWLAPINPGQLHSWTLADLGERINGVERALAPAGQSYLLTTPKSTLDAVHTRAQVAIGRLVFISSLIVGVLLAFAAFAAAIERSDVELEDRRLRAAGASRPARLLFIAGEALVPAIAGAIVGELGAALAVGLVASAQGAPVDVVLGLALLQPAGIGLTVLLVGLALVAIVLGIHPAAGRLLQARVVIAAVVPVGLILAWQRISAGPLSPAQLAADATSPSSALVPGVLGLSVILGSLLVLPPLLRGLARITRRAPIGIRLAAISVAREPLRPAAVMTLLAFSVGAVVFGQVYSSTLRQGGIDQAAFLAGLDVRGQSLGEEAPFALRVVPLLRAGQVGTDVKVVPMIVHGGETATHRILTLAGIDATAIPELKGWRSDFSTTPAAELGRALKLDGEWQLVGHPLPSGVREIVLDVDYVGDPIQLVVVVEESDGAVRYIDLGELVPGRQVMRAALFDERELDGLPSGEPAGWRVLGLFAANGGDARDGGPAQGQRQQGEATIKGLAPVVDPAIPVSLNVAGLSPQFIRPPARTDGLVLPALVSPDLAADVDASGVLDILIEHVLQLRVRPVAVTTHFPTLGLTGVVVMDLAPLQLAINSRYPGAALPNQVLVGTPNDVRAAEVVAALEQDPFPSMVIRSRPVAEEANLTDPFAIGVVWALAVGAVAGLLLSVVGVLLAAASDLRDERGELWELESQGTTPRSLVGLVLLRTVAMCAIGTVTGIAAGIALGWFVASSVGVGGGGTVPIPPLILVVPWGFIVGLAAVLLGVISLTLFVLAQRHFARASLGAGTR
ncbi:MAG: FtsX-like permease family protein [Candidatus Limnocylindrales bacterium]